MKKKALFSTKDLPFGRFISYFLVLFFTLFSYLGCKEKIEPVIQMDQQVSLQNYVDINYSATLENLKEANRTIYHDGDIINEKKVGDGYTEVLAGLSKGKYEFELLIGDKRNEKSVTVPEYKPEADQAKWDSLKTNIENNSEINLDLKDMFYDRNVEDTNVPIVGVKSLDEKTNVELNGDSLRVSQKSGEFGNYQVEVEFGTPEGGLAKKVLGGYLKGADEIVFMGMVLENTSFGEKYNRDIYTMKLDGSNPVRLTTNSANDTNPSYSPDGEKIAFISGRGQDATYIYTMNTDGSQITKIDLKLDYIWGPNWGPNGKIAFTYRKDGLAGIATVNPDGTEYTQLVEEPDSGSLPGEVSWSSDGNKISYSGHSEGNWEIYTMNSDGTNQTNITNSPGHEAMPSWFHDGNKIIFGRRENENWNLYMMNNDGTNEEQITNDLGDEKNPVFSQDGKKIIFSYSIDMFSPQSLYIMDADGTNWKEITNFISDNPKFKPN